MGRKRMPGLYKRGETWHIDKKVFGQRICESTGTDSLEEAEKYLARRIEEVRQAKVFGVRPQRSFEQAAAKFLVENQHKASIRTDAYLLNSLMPFIGSLALGAVHIGSLQPYIAARRKEGKKTRTINHALQIVRRILNLAAGEWLDEHGLTWLQVPPKIKLLPELDLREPNPLSWEEQARLLKELPPHLERMALFAANSGCRDGEICGLRWDWEVKVPELPGGSIFLIPLQKVKNRHERLVILNEVARSVVEHVRGQNPEYVFTFRNKPIDHMLNSAWRKARLRAGMPQARVHDLKHTFGRRLRSAGVGFEDRQDLLGHCSKRITTHYSAAELMKLYEAANSVCKAEKSGVTLTMLKRDLQAAPAKVPQGVLRELKKVI